MDSKLTPMMRQYLDIKKKHQDDILFFRMGDFYEMFFEDAQEASKILDIALTSRQNDVPMCGVPYHAADSYIARLIKAGKRVAICEQMENVPSSGTIVRREVVRIVTPGTVIEQNLLQSDDNNFLGSVIVGRDRIGLAFVDISTGDFFISSIEKSLDLFRGEIARFGPSEVVFLEGDAPEDIVFAEHMKNRGIPLYRINEWLYDREFMHGLICEVFGTASTKGLGITDDIDIVTAGSILQYLKEAHRRAFDHLKHPQKMLSSERMVLDDATITNLELVTGIQEGGRKRTLFSVLDHTMTAMGKRALERNVLQPLLDRAKIERRLDIVQYFHEFHRLTDDLKRRLKEIHDIERILSRFTLGRIYPRNFLALVHSLNAAAKIKNLLAEQPHDRSRDLADAIPDLGELSNSLSAAIADDPALSPEQGPVIRRGYDPELDRLYGLKTDARDWVVRYQEEEKARLNIPTLKVKYNRILGYYIEMSKNQAVNVPEGYYRKQTLVGSERFTTDRLQEFETDILSASDKIISIEKTLLEKLKDSVLSAKDALQTLAGAIAEIDFHASLASAALENRYVRPEFNDNGSVSIRDGRHPVVEKYYTREVFIPNDVHLDSDENTIALITGPNMAGKSTYIRMAAVIQLMAQIGSFVPAASADLSVVDRIFTRIGASDNISRGESTFLVEMNETAVILNNATERSLIIMDEVGRGTSTYDGLSIAWAIVEYIQGYLRSKTLFATHYHELTRLGSKKGMVNYNVLVRDQAPVRGVSGVEFLHKVAKGAADRSYGIHVAQLAGIPKQITSRASTILERLENTKKQIAPPEDTESAAQLEIFNAANHRVIQAIRSIDIENITPMDALNELNRLKKIVD